MDLLSRKWQRKQEKQSPALLEDRFYALADSVGYPKEEIFRNMYPTFIEYSSGDPHYTQKA
ncbi:hypothetical protein GCM10020331_082730 [Ectobacillus funiculus]